MNVSCTYIVKKRSKKEYVQNDRVLKNDRKKNEVGGWMGFIRHRSFLFRQLAMNRLSYCNYGKTPKDDGEYPCG